MYAAFLFYLSVGFYLGVSTNSKPKNFLPFLFGKARSARVWSEEQKTYVHTVEGEIFFIWPKVIVLIVACISFLFMIF